MYQKLKKSIDEKILMSNFATMCHFGSYEVIRYV